MRPRLGRPLCRGRPLPLRPLRPLPLWARRRGSPQPPALARSGSPPRVLLLLLLRRSVARWCRLAPNWCNFTAHCVQIFQWCLGVQFKFLVSKILCTKIIENILSCKENLTFFVLLDIFQFWCPFWCNFGCLWCPTLQNVWQH